LRVLCHPPDWGEVVPADFLHSMNITATLSTDGELSDDIYDRVGVFIDDKLHGTANVLFVEPLDGLADTHAYEVYLTVYGNDASVGKALEFRVWDASACSELGLVLENFDFGINATHGTPTNPATITATSQIIGTLPFPAGWTWFSLNLIADDMSTNVVLGTLAPESQDILRAQRSFSQYVPGAGWVGSLGQLANESMYLLNLSRPDTLQVIGYAVDVETTSIPVEQGWNWIGYLPQQSMAVNRALESLNAQTGDVVKSQFEFAQFVEGLGWMGSLRFMNPRMAYQLSAQEAGTLAYPFFAGDPATKTAEPTRMATPSGWAVDPRAYRYNMPLVVRIAGNGVTLDSESDVIAAFVGDEVRGVGQTVYVPSQDRYLSFLMVYGNTAEGEPVEFRFYDADQHRERFVATEAEFRADALRGGVHVPFVLETRERRLGDRGFVPDSFVLGQSYPNPFNPSTKIGYGLPQDGQIEIAVYNLLGQKIRTLVSGFEKAGYRHVTWDGRTNESQLVPSGMYFYVMESGNFRDVKKVMLLK
ncbi:MAG: T9SS type A sorting domain-containing protein, partial [Gemmatimonadetes bacterium]|nr:T9SS type A sorting domain-containing protein [Gemmatimonadota bacterium]